MFVALFGLRLTGNSSGLTLVCLYLGRDAELCISGDGFFESCTNLCRYFNLDFIIGFICERRVGKGNLCN